MYNVEILIEYDGTNYGGWQVQPNANSIQQEIEKALEKILKHRVRITGSGRTDAGVHAREQHANFKIRKKMPVSAFKEGLNSMLPEDIRIKKARYAAADFNARFSAKERIYRYFLTNEKDKAIGRQYVTYTPYVLDIEKMQNAAEILAGTHNFKCFSMGAVERNSFIRTINYIKIAKRGRKISIEISANAFLRRMVRALVGTLIDVGRGYLVSKDVLDILHCRRKVPTFAPAKGLFLWKVRY